MLSRTSSMQQNHESKCSSSGLPLSEDALPKPQASTFSHAQKKERSSDNIFNSNKSSTLKKKIRKSEGTQTPERLGTRGGQQDYEQFPPPKGVPRLSTLSPEATTLVRPHTGCAWFDQPIRKVQSTCGRAMHPTLVAASLGYGKAHPLYSEYITHGVYVVCVCVRMCAPYAYV